MLQVLELSSSSLEVALQTLTERLSVQSGHSSGIDPVSIGQTADAMNKVLQALAQAKSMRDV